MQFAKEKTPVPSVQQDGQSHLPMSQAQRQAVLQTKEIKRSVYWLALLISKVIQEEEKHKQTFNKAA